MKCVVLTRCKIGIYVLPSTGCCSNTFNPNSSNFPYNKTNRIPFKLYLLLFHLFSLQVKVKLLIHHNTLWKWLTSRTKSLSFAGTVPILGPVPYTLVLLLGIFLQVWLAPPVKWSLIYSIQQGPPSLNRSLRPVAHRADLRLIEPGWAPSRRAHRHVRQTKASRRRPHGTCSGTADRSPAIRSLGIGLLGELLHKSNQAHRGHVGLEGRDREQEVQLAELELRVQVQRHREGGEELGRGADEVLGGLGSDQLVDEDRVIEVLHEPIEMNDPDIVVGCGFCLAGRGEAASHVDVLPPTWRRDC